MSGIPDLQELVNTHQCKGQFGEFITLFFVRVSEVEKLLNQIKRLHQENRKLQALVDGFLDVAKEGGDIT